MSIQEEYIKIQTCVLRVNIHCEGCRKNVKKLLKKIEGVYIVNMDSGHGKVKVRVTMAAEMSPEVLAKKLNRKGKISEMLVPQPASGGSLMPGANNDGDGWACEWGVRTPTPAPTPMPLVGGGSSVVPTPGPQVLKVKPSPAPSKKSEQAEDEWDDSDDEEAEDEEDEEDDEDEEEEELPAQNKVDAPAHASSVGSRVPSKVGTPNVNVGVDGADNVTFRGAQSNLQKSASKNIAGGNSIQSGRRGGGGGDLSKAMRAGGGVPMGGGGQNMGQQIGGQFQSTYGLPPRLNAGPFIMNPNPYQHQQQPQQLAAAMNMNYQHPRPVVPDGIQQHMAFGHPYQNMHPQYQYQYPAYQYQYATANQAPPHRSGSRDDFLYAFNDENTQSCSIM